MDMKDPKIISYLKGMTLFVQKQWVTVNEGHERIRK